MLFIKNSVNAQQKNRKTTQSTNYAAQVNSMLLQTLQLY